MKKLICFILMYTFVLTTVAFAADVAPMAVVAPVAAPSFVMWFMANLAPIFGVLLTITELMSLSPWFAGNGIVDTIIKALKFLVQVNTNKPTDAGTL